MAFSFDDLREKVTDLAQSGVAKSKQLAEIAKLKTSNMGEEDTIKKAYLELGRLYYAERGAAPEGAYAAQLIDECGLKGMQVGGAMVSEKHAGFLINAGGATCADMLELIRRVQEIVADKTGSQLEREVEIWQ